MLSAAPVNASPRAVKGEPQQALGRGFVLQGFDRATDELRIELHLKPVPLDRRRLAFDVGDDPEMHDAYLLDTAKAGVLAPLVSELIDIEKHDFFLTALRVAPSDRSGIM